MTRRCLLLFLGCCVLATGCEPAHRPGASTKPPVVRVAEPVEREVTDYAFFTGRTDAPEYVQVRARVTGYLFEIDFESGKEVKKDQRLFKIDPRPYKADLDRANGQVLLNEAKLKLAVADYERAKEVAKTPGAISQQELDKYAAAQSEADAAVKAAKANAEGADLNLKFTDVISPIDGVVGRNLLTIGNLVTADQTLLTTVVSQDEMYAYFDVDERTMLRVQKMIREGKMAAAKEGREVPVEFGLANEGDEYPHKGHIDFVNNQVDASTGTLQVRGVLANPKPERGPRLLTPGLFVRVRLPIGDPHKALLLPQAAVGTDQGKKYLLVVNDKDVIEYRPVTLGEQQPGGLVVVEPVPVMRTEKGVQAVRPGEKGEPSLKAGERVVVTGLQRVRPGVTVDARPFEEEAP
jgi:multidrug efflux system membrane fusion protein